MKRGIVFWFFLVLGKVFFAQDLHFTQFNRTPLFLNPALTGAFIGDIRVMGIFRNQWATAVPYNSGGVSADYNIPFKYSQNKVGLGVQLIADRSGDGKFTTVQASFSAAYHLVSSAHNPTMLSLGAVGNLVQRSYDPNLLTFDYQFNGNYFDPTRPIGEQLDRTSLSFFDMGMGLNLTQAIAEEHSLNIGGSVQHIFETNQNFLTQSSNALLARKYNAYLYAEARLNAQSSIIPLAFYQYQDLKHETVTGLGYQYRFNADFDNETKLTIGCSYRWGDAWIPWVQLQPKKWSAQLSYDWNTSPFRIGSESYGGVELSVGLVFSYRESSERGRGKTAPNFCPYIWY